MKMALPRIRFSFLILYFFMIILLVQSRLNLHAPDRAALSLILRDFGIRTAGERNPCDSAGIFCERRISNNSYVPRITRLVFESQQLKGKISPAIGQLSELKEISLKDNLFFDQIPFQIAECQKLEVLNIAKNRFSGEIPPGLSSLVRLRVLDLSSNKFTGNLKFLKHFPNMEKLNLADNMFAGKLPVSLRSFRNLRFINISGNSLLKGPLPLMNQVEDFSAKFEEERNSIPKRYMFAEKSNQTNPAMGPSSSQESAPSPRAVVAPHKPKKNRRKIVGWIVGFLAGALAGSASGFVFSLLYKLIMFLIKGRGKDKSLKIFSPIIKNPEDLAFLQNEDGLASLEIIGRGGCGEVYKAVLPGSDGKEIAIKKVSHSPRDTEELTDEDSKLLDKKMRQIRSEIQTVGEIRHKNLLPLLAYMPRPNCHFLVYEYMKNGSVQDYIQHVSQGNKQLDWPTRFKIALGVASGLEYLHMNHTSRIIHRDLKPANVLLDDEMEARISDFGLAKAVPEYKTHVTTSNIAGTAGYIAPEYHQTFKFTDKCDIYSFGVLLGGLVTGKFPSDEFFQHTEEVGLVKWMRNVMTSEDPKRALDPNLLGNGYEEQMLLVLKVACFCTLDNPKERPNSKDARCMLSQIKH
ncbi:leucine-rich repeat receptor-like serine/threonine/tyrosine-protein kinase SOBIR1 [Primulina huaijiensis]|uniref:leucine-rich repeat receptor-like serine/threonine/tyrosine-protein kinase SOBIR1 n=1 Tax=Primulina huaijiensis TaxID=1492673 RepID=UPI003CC6E9B5